MRNATAMCMCVVTKRIVAQYASTGRHYFEYHTHTVV